MSKTPHPYASFVRKLIKEAAKDGYEPMLVHDGEEKYTVAQMSTEEIIEIATATDEATMKFRNVASNPIGYFVVYLVYGNCIWETVCDCTDTPACHAIVDRVSDHFLEKEA